MIQEGMPQPVAYRLAMAAAGFAILLSLPAPAFAQKVLFVVRHAERADDGAAAGQMQAQTDPPLSAIGQARATRLAAMLADAGVAAVYATEYRRTQDTARPLATRLGVELTTIGARNQDELVSTLRTRHADDVVLVVGHSNTVPAIVQAFGDSPGLTLAEDEYSSLFLVIPATRTVIRLRF